MELDILNPTEILTRAGVTKSTVIADFGCGPGIFALPAARITQSTVYCLDILPTAIETVSSKARTMNIVNVEPRRVNLENEGGSTLPENSIDLVIMRKILCQRQDNTKIFSEASRVLRDEGSILIVGWTPEATIGPEPADRASIEDIQELARNAGFQGFAELASDQQHFVLELRK